MGDRTLRENAVDFINYKHSLGYTYEGQEYVLNRYVTFAESRTSSPMPLANYTKRHLFSVSSADIYWYEALKRHMCFRLK